MQAIHPDNVNWKSLESGVREAKIFSDSRSSEETRITLVEVPAGGYIPSHRHSSRRDFITILESGGAQIQVGERIFRPLSGQVFHREPEEIFALTNDSHHPFRYTVTSFGYEESDVIWEDEVTESRSSEEPGDPKEAEPEAKEEEE